MYADCNHISGFLKKYSCCDHNTGVTCEIFLEKPLKNTSVVAVRMTAFKGNIKKMIARTYPCTHSRIYPCIWPCTCLCTYSFIHPCTCLCTYSFIHPCTYLCTYSFIHPCTHPIHVLLFVLFSVNSPYVKPPRIFHVRSSAQFYM